MANDTALQRRTFLIGASALALAGCSGIVGPQEAPSLYLMRPEFPPAPPSAGKVPWSLAVMWPSAPAVLAGTRIAILQPGGIMDFYADAAYPDSLPDLVQQTMIQGFEASGRIDNVSRSSDSIYADYSLFVEIRDFHARYAVADGIPEAVVTLHLRLTRARGRRQVGTLTVNQTVPATANSIPAATEALAQALGRATGQVTSWALNFPPPAPEPIP